MALFDFLSSNKKRRKSGGRSGGRKQGRDADERTQAIQPPTERVQRGAVDDWPQATTEPRPVHDPTTVNQNRSSLQPDPPAPPPPPPPLRTPPPPPPRPSDDDRTIINTDSSLSSRRGLVGVLAAIDGEFEGNLFGIYDGDNVIGRGEDCDIFLPSPSKRISRTHAKLIHNSGIFYVQAMKKDNPTLLNGAPVEQADEVADGDTITLGKTTLKFRTV